jgi:hypothetical protein
LIIEISGLFQKSQTIFLDIQQRIVYKGIKSSCKESFLGRERDPQRTPNSFFAGFFIKPRRASYQDLTKAGKNGKGGARSKGLIFLLTSNQKRRTLYAFHKDLHIYRFKSGHWIFWLHYGAEGGGSQTRANHKEFGSTEGGGQGAFFSCGI